MIQYKATITITNYYNKTCNYANIEHELESEASLSVEYPIFQATTVKIAPTTFVFYNTQTSVLLPLF